MAKRSKIKMGIIGTGGMANAHASNYAQIPGVDLHMAMDVLPDRAEAFGEMHGFAWSTTELDDVLAECDAVSIVTPDKFHAPLSLAVLKAGVHLLCEKPLTLTLADARKVAKAAQAASQQGVVHMINFSYRNSASFHTAAKMVADGKLGEIRHVYGRYLQAWIATQVWGPWNHERWLWRMQTQAGSGGVLGDVGCHLLDYITGIAGPAEKLRCSFYTHPKIDPKTGKAYTKYGKFPLDANDTANIEIQFAEGGSGVAHTTRWATGQANQVALEVFGTEGALAIDLNEGGQTLHTLTGPARHKTGNRDGWKTVNLKPTPNMYQRFIKSIKTGVNDQPDLVRGAEVQAYLDACERSAAKQGAMMPVLKWV